MDYNFGFRNLRPIGEDVYRHSPSIEGTQHTLARGYIHPPSHNEQEIRTHPTRSSQLSKENKVQKSLELDPNDSKNEGNVSEDYFDDSADDETEDPLGIDTKPMIPTSSQVHKPTRNRKLLEQYNKCDKEGLKRDRKVSLLLDDDRYEWLLACLKCISFI